VLTCLRGATGVCPSVTGYASENAIASSFAIQIRSEPEWQKGQESKDEE
jgi:hypothetical protein